MVPVNYGFHYENGKLTLYFHGAYEGLKSELIEKNGRVGFEMDTGVRMIPHEKNPCLFTNHYESIIGSGRVAAVTDIQKKQQILACFMKQASGKDWEFTPEMARSCAVFALEAEEFQAKRNGTVPLKE